jgi:hypothetical protein
MAEITEEERMISGEIIDASTSPHPTLPQREREKERGRRLRNL